MLPELIIKFKHGIRLRGGSEREREELYQL
jgi:hypothetical protein